MLAARWLPHYGNRKAIEAWWRIFSSLQHHNSAALSLYSCSLLLPGVSSSFEEGHPSFSRLHASAASSLSFPFLPLVSSSQNLYFEEGPNQLSFILWNSQPWSGAGTFPPLTLYFSGPFYVLSSLIRMWVPWGWRWSFFLFVFLVLSTVPGAHSECLISTCWLEENSR